MYSSALIAALAFSGAALAQRNLAVDATINVASTPATIAAAAAALTLTDGSYYVQNVASNQTLTYARDQNGQELWPDDGTGSPMTFQGIGAYTVVTPTESNAKCISAQWDYITEGGCDWAGALYACRVGNSAIGSSKRRRSHRLSERDVPLRLAKQYWYIIPGSTENAYKIVPVDHLLDMTPRAMNNGIRIARANNAARYPALVQLDNTDLTQEWYLTPAN